MTKEQSGLRCHDADACAMGQLPCPTPEACGCAPAGQSEAQKWITFYESHEDAASIATAEVLRSQHARIAELEAERIETYRRLADETLRANQMAEQHRMQCNIRADLEAQLSAIGAGGVETLRKREWNGNAPKGGGITDDAAAIQAMQSAQPSRECLQQSAVDEAVTLLHKYKGLCVAANRGDMYHLKRIEDAAAALQAAPPAPAAVAVPTMNEAGYLPCPFCGSGDVSLSVGEHGDGTPWHYVECGLCAAVTEPDQWNTREVLAASQAQEHATQLAGQGQGQEPAFLQRLRAEQRELSDRQGKLEAFLETHDFHALTDDGKGLLRKQESQQHALLQTLNQRIHSAAEQHLRSKNNG